MAVVLEEALFPFGTVIAVLFSIWHHPILSEYCKKEIKKNKATRAVLASATYIHVYLACWLAGMLPLDNSSFFSRARQVRPVKQININQPITQIACLATEDKRAAIDELEADIDMLEARSSDG